MTLQRQFAAAMLSLLCSTSFPVQAKLAGADLGLSESARVEERLTKDLRRQGARVLAYFSTLSGLDVHLNFEWNAATDFVTDLQRGDVMILVPRSLGTIAALDQSADRLRNLRAIFTHQLGHVIYAAAGGGGDPAFAELFGDVLTAVDLNDPGAVTRAFAVDGRLPDVPAARLRAFDPRPRELSAREWGSPAYRLNLVKSEVSRRAEWAKLSDRAPERGAYLRRLLAALIAVARTDYGPATGASAARMNADVIKALGPR